ncbi:MAG: hypothetical protein IT262_07755 [Saprospiraceae bacterium]|nr:hypothetical protein [Saprospiraceae bacterium]
MPIIFLVFSLFFSSESFLTSKSIDGTSKETTKKTITPTEGEEFIIGSDVNP